MATRAWSEIYNMLDYLDASESDTTRLSMTSYHPVLRSEIHMSFCLSAEQNMVLYPDHNPATRSVFSIAQQKSASSWYHTNFKKRFDNTFNVLVSPQKPLSQTWLYNEMIGNGLALGGQPDVPATLHKRIEGHRGGILKWGERATVFIGGHAGFAHRCARKYSG
jgi:DNA-directed RNA polymerase beta subunit